MVKKTQQDGSQKQKNKKLAKEASLSFTDPGWDTYLYWSKNDPKIFGKLNDLIEEVQRTPFTGTGKPEPLKDNLTGYWSRRLTKEHRLVYLYEAGTLYIISCRYHY